MIWSVKVGCWLVICWYSIAFMQTEHYFTVEWNLFVAKLLTNQYKHIESIGSINVTHTKSNYSCESKVEEKNRTIEPNGKNWLNLFVNRAFQAVLYVHFSDNKVNTLNKTQWTNGGITFKFTSILCGNLQLNCLSTLFFPSRSII